MTEIDGASAVAGLIAGIILIAIIILFPLAVIWALSTLFGLAIPINFWTWLAVVVLLFAFGGIRLGARAG